MKNIFGDLVFKKDLRLGAINSVNWARLLEKISKLKRKKLREYV